MPETAWLETGALSALIFLVAALYASVGHGGASGYLAAMALFGLAPETMKPAALSLNLFVAGIASYKYIRAGYFNWRLCWPFLLASIPFSFLGGLLQLPDIYYKPLVALVLLYLPLGYMIGGPIIYAPPEELEPVDMSAEVALKLAVTAFVGGEQEGERK